MSKKISHQKLWCAIRVYKDFSIPKIAQRCGVDFDLAQEFVFMLRRQDYVTWQEGDTDHTLFRLIRDTGGLAPSQNYKGFKDPNMAGQVTDAYQRIWNTISHLKTWDCYSLASMAQTTYAKAFRYSQGLATNEYAKCEARDKRIRTSRDQYRLCNKTGAIAPLFLEDGSVFDSNLFLQELWNEQKKPRRTRSPKPKAEVWIL